MRAEMGIWRLRLVAVGAFVAVAATAATWTGAQDAFWTNAANWAEGTVPGKYYAPDGTLAGATVTFVNTSLLDENRPGGYPFLSVSGTVDNPPVADASLPTPWFIMRAGNEFKVVYPHGTVLLFR